MYRISNTLLVHGSCNSVVSPETRLRTGLQRNRGLISGRSWRLLPKACRPPVGSTESATQWMSGALSQGTAGHSPPYIVEVWSCTSTHLHALLRCGAVPPLPRMPSSHAQEKCYINFTYIALSLLFRTWNWVKYFCTELYVLKLLSLIKTHWNFVAESYMFPLLAQCGLQKGGRHIS
jgi:hypothetical protein